MKDSSAKRRQLRVKLGEVVYRTGVFRLVLPGLNPNCGPVRRRLNDYLRHYLEEGGRMPATLRLGPDRVRLRCDLNDHMLKPQLQGERGLYEEDDINHCASFLRPGDVLIDIGANHGFWGFLLAARQPEIGQLVAVEANPELASRLRITKRLNPGIPTTILEKAITSPGVEEVTFYLPMPNPVGNLSGLGSIVLHETAVENQYLCRDQAIVCPAITLDALVDQLALKRVDLLKIDVEQAEDLVIEGAHQVIQHLRPRLVMMETGWNSQASRAMLEAGYRAHILIDSMEPCSSIPEGYWGNIFFTTPSA